MLNIFYYPYQGGTEKHLMEVCRRLARNHDVTILSSAMPNTPKEEVVQGVRLVRSPGFILEKLPYPIPPPVPFNPTHLLDVHREAKNADVVHIHNRFAYNLLDTFMVRKMLDKKLAVTLHNARPMGIDWQTDLFAGMYDDLFVEPLFKNCERIAGVSQNTLDITVPAEYKQKTQVIYNGVDVKKYHPINKSGNKCDLFGDKMVFCVSRLVEQKGLKYLLNAFKIVVDAEPEARLVILGKGPLLEQLQAKALKLGIKKNVFFEHRQVSEKELLEYYSACKVFALPSLWEPFGMVFVEAMACGKPVIGSSAGGIPEIVESGKTGFLVPPRNHLELADKILEVLASPAKAARMGVRARASVEKKFTWENTAASYERFYSLFDY